MSRKTLKPVAQESSPGAAVRQRSGTRAHRGGSTRPARLHPTAGTFAALGDSTRLSLLARLSRGQRSSISQLSHGSHLTRQAITKHLRVLERASIVRCVRAGRESLYSLNPEPVQELRRYLDGISAEWDQALARLRSTVEK